MVGLWRELTDGEQSADLCRGLELLLDAAVE